MIPLLAQAAKSPLFSAQSFLDAVTIATGAGGLSTVWHLSVGAHCKEYPFIRNRWVIFILPPFALVTLGVVIVAGNWLGYALHPVAVLGAFVGWIGGALGAPPTFKAAQNGPLTNAPIVGGILSTLSQSGPNNNPLDAAQAAKPPPPPPATSDTTPPPAPSLPPLPPLPPPHP